MTAHPLAGRFSVDASARRIRRYRWLEERVMRILGGWIALTPELPAKLLFGRHVWDCAQHADLWGRRLPELRSPAHRGEPPSEGFARLMDRIDARDARHETVERIVAIYRLVKPHLIAAYEAHLAEANAIYEPPTRRILDRCVEEERRHVAAGTVVLTRLFAQGGQRADDWEGRLREELIAAGGLDPEVGVPAPTGPSPDPDGDLVALDSAFDPAVIEDDLATALEAHRRALIAGDLGALTRQISEPSGALEMYNALVPVGDATVVAGARIGAFRIVKLALRGPRGLSIIQLEWRRDESGWRIARGAVVRSEPLR
jgi:hypothetical protein